MIPLAKSMATRGSFKDGKFLEGVHIFDLNTNKWSKYTYTPEQGPRSRHFHTTVLYKNQMILFGGKNNSYLNDLWQFDLDLRIWSRINVVSGTPPSKRFGHSCVLWNNSLWVYGGYDDFESRIWHKIETLKVEYPNGAPLRLELYQHGAVVHNNSMFVFGGKCDKKEEFNNDILQYTFGTKTWARVNAKGKLPSPRYGHRVIAFHDRMYCIGGSDYVLDFDKEIWSKVDNLPTTFTPRFFHSLCIYENSIYVIAGRNRHGYSFSEIFKYSSDKISAIPNTDSLVKSTLALLTNSDYYSDITFHFPKEDKSLYAHKGILISRCELFATMFRSSMKEGRDAKEMIMEEDSYHIFLTFLLFLYTSVACTHNFSLDDYVELLFLSNRFFLQELKLICEKRMHQFINIKSVLHLYDVATRANASNLSRKCTKTVAKFYEELKDQEMPPLLVAEVQEILQKEAPKGIPMYS